MRPKRWIMSLKTGVKTSRGFEFNRNDTGDGDVVRLLEIDGSPVPLPFSPWILLQKKD